MRSKRIHCVLTIVSALVACKGSPPSTACASNSDCASNEVCVSGTCASSAPDAATDAGGVHDAGRNENPPRDSGNASMPDANGMGQNDAGNPEDAGNNPSDAGPADAGQMHTGAITCSTPSTSYQMNVSGSPACGTERWSVKTGTDNDVQTVNLVPQVTTIPQLRALSVPANQSASCNRNAPTETQVWELQNVKMHFVSLESDDDYHIVVTDPSDSTATMIVEVPWPGCIGHDSCSSSAPFKCDITHARAAADAIKISGQDTVGTVMGVGFFDFLHGQDGVAPNGIELHPVLAICFGQNCDPLQGY